jgi:hypothetical protein
MEVLDPIMHFNQAMELKDIYRIPCSPTGNLDVIVIATASTAINYQIIKKDNVPFLVNNGNSNIFTNLLPGTYTFLIMDDCGNSILRVFDISRLISLVVAYPPSDISRCSLNPTTENFDLSTPIQMKIYDVLGGLILDCTLNETQKTIETNNWESGIYSIELIQNQINTHNKIIIK